VGVPTAKLPTCIVPAIAALGDGLYANGLAVDIYCFNNKYTAIKKGD
jgi:hypothetical protein